MLYLTETITFENIIFILQLTTHIHIKSIERRRRHDCAFFINVQTNRRTKMKIYYKTISDGEIFYKYVMM